MSKTPEGSPSSADVKNNTPEGSSSNADVKNNSEKLPVFGKLGQAAVRAAVRVAESAADYLNRVAETGEKYINEHTGADAGKSTSEKSETLATSASNDAEEGKADASQGKNAGGGAKSTSKKQAPDTNEAETKKGKADNSQGKNASEGAKSTPEKQDSNANKPEAKKGKADASQGKNAGGGAKSTSKKQAPDTNEAETKKGKADASDTSVDTSGKNAGGGAKSTSKKQTPDTNEAENTKGKADNSQENQAPDAAERFMSNLRKSLDEKKRQDQGSSAAESSKDKQDKDSNPNTGEAQTKESSPEKREAADELEKAKDRHSKAYAAAESKNPLGKKRRQAELKAATEQLKKCELLDKAADKLDESRERFAKASVDVESHFFKRKKRQEELNAATEELKKSGLGYMSIKFADKIEAAKQDPEKQAELAAEMAQAVFASMQETSRVTADRYDNMLDDRSRFKKAAAKVGKWFNKGGEVFQWLKLGSVGFVAGTATGFLAGYAGYAGFPITTAVGAVTGLGVAGLTKQAVLEEHRGEDRIAADARLETTDPSFKNTVANMKIDDVMEHAVNVSVDNLKDMSIERQDDLRKRTRRAMTKYGIAFALGGVVGGLLNWTNSAHATGAESQKTPATPSQSGSGQIPQQSGSTSSMHNIVNSANPDTLNFSSYDYPYSWAADKFGDANAMDQLHNLADKAMANGHTVEWFNNPDGSVWMKVDGSSATKHVLDVLSRYV